MSLWKKTSGVTFRAAGCRRGAMPFDRGMVQQNSFLLFSSHLPRDGMLGYWLGVFGAPPRVALAIIVSRRVGCRVGRPRLRKPPPIIPPRAPTAASPHFTKILWKCQKGSPQKLKRHSGIRGEETPHPLGAILEINVSGAAPPLAEPWGPARGTSRAGAVCYPSIRRALSACVQRGGTQR